MKPLPEFDYNGYPKKFKYKIFDDFDSLELIQIPREDRFVKEENPFYYPPLMPAVPKAKGGYIKRDGYLIVPDLLYCTCRNGARRAGIYPKYDLRRSCKHLLWHFTRPQNRKWIDDLSFLIMKESVVKFGLYFYRIIDEGNIFLVSSTPGANWIKFYYKDRKGIWRAKNYSLKENRWKYNIAPEDNEYFETLIARYRHYIKLPAYVQINRR